jgi:peptidoglycan hydrolase CwlO-like protein
VPVVNAVGKDDALMVVRCRWLPKPGRASPGARWAAVLIVGLLIAAAGLPGSAQSDEDAEPPGDDAESIQQERERLEAAEAAKAREVHAANAELGEVTGALVTLQGRVDAQAARVDYANQQLADAEKAAAAATEEVAMTEQGIADLETRLSDRAIETFMGDATDNAVQFVVADPTRAVMMETLLSEMAQSDLDLVADLQAAREDLEVRQAEARNAVDATVELRAAAEELLADLEDDRSAQTALVGSAEDRLDHLLSERAALEALGADADAGLAVDTALVDALAGSPEVPASSGSPVPSATDIRSVGNGISVHVSIADEVARLLANAAADGVPLAGGGYRDPAAQIAVRKANCGTSSYAIYEMPASRCSPPTARPGTSMHEQGLAIDFTYQGRIISSRSGVAWNWLQANAAGYGLYNLPSEPWHWSTNGN